jgi:hypothetical protein
LQRLFLAIARTSADFKSQVLDAGIGEAVAELVRQAVSQYDSRQI